MIVDWLTAARSVMVLAMLVIMCFLQASYSVMCCVVLL